MNEYKKIVDYIEDCASQVQYINTFLHGSDYDLNNLKDTATFPLLMSLRINSAYNVVNGHSFVPTWNASLEFQDLDHLNNSDQEKRTDIINAMHNLAMQFLNIFNKNDENIDIESIEVTPFDRIPTSVYYTTGVRLDIRFTTPANFSYCRK